MNINLIQIPEKKRAIVKQMVTELMCIKEITAIALGGSYATGKAHSESDIDLGLYYQESTPLPIEALQQLVNAFDKNAVVTQLYEWGPWVNGGVWLNTDAGKIDLIFRNINQISHVISDAQKGKWYWDFAQQPPNGFYSVIYLAELKAGIALYDPQNSFELLKKTVVIYPEPLHKSLIQDNLWGAEFTLEQAKKFAKRADVYSAAGCVTRICAYLTQVLFALNHEYFLTDKGALDTIELFSLKPYNHKQNIVTLLTSLGKTTDQLNENLLLSEKIIGEVKELTRELYKKKY